MDGVGLLTFEDWEAGLRNLGYECVKASPQGAALFRCEGKQSYRVSPFEPNEATAAWLKRTDTKDARCQPNECDIPYYDRQSDLPEFGLEGGDGYHDDLSHVTKSMLAVFKGSPVEYRETYILGTMPKKKATEPMKLGTICHAMLLEHKTVEEAAIAYPYSCFTDGGRIRRKEADLFATRVAPLIAVRAEVMQVAQKIVDRARRTEFGALFDLHGDRMKFEQRVDAELYGVKCKCKPDLHIVLDDVVIVPDLKFGAYKKEDWDRSARRFSYWLQQAHYTAILEATYGKPVSWSFWAGETKPPYRFGPKEYDDRSMELARQKHKELLLDLKRCYETGVFEDRFTGVTTVRQDEFGDDYEDPVSGVAVDLEDEEYESVDIQL